ncbi:MAG: sigma-70 family RNA polymerase sigma factor [Flavobacteriaceae bacterium]|nr:sigma-70 family RNA polymerase sigma factor [Flavobacteriaceae bacterium]
MENWDEGIIDEMKQGNAIAFERCYRIISPQIFTVIYKVCRNHETAQELLQDTFIDIFESLYCYTSKQSFLAWAKRIAFNNTLNFIKRNSRMVLMEELPQESFEIECDLTKQLIDSQLIESLLAKVTEVERLILWLFIVEQYNHEEIAVLVSKTPSYSKSIVSRALKRIRLLQEVKDHAYK